MTADPAGCVAVVTGASRGLGAGLARAFADRGLRLGLCARSAPVLSSGPDVVAVRLDVAEPVAVESFCAEVSTALGPIDLWVNNAGVLDPMGPLRDLDPDELSRSLAVNVLGVLHGSRSFVRHRRQLGGGGVLVNISSGAAQQGRAGWAAYSAAKGAVDRLTESVQAEEAEVGLRAYAVAPGVVDTDMQARIRDSTPEEFPDVEKFVAMKREGRFNSPAWVARHLLAYAFDDDDDDPDHRPDQVVVRVPDEHAQD